jgi:NADH-quinone oxidoreductase subunit M
VLLVGVLGQGRHLRMIRFCLPLFPDASQWATPVVITLAVHRDPLRRAAGHRADRHEAADRLHVDLALRLHRLGIFAMTSQGQSGATLYMVNHGFSTAALFLIAGFLISRRGSRLIADYGGVQRVAPMLAGTFLVAGLSSLALPGLSSFVSEFLVLVGTFSRYEEAAVFATGGIILASLYILLMYQRTMTGEPTEHTSRFADLSTREAWVVAPLIAVIIALGFFPKPLLDVINPAVDRTMQQVGVSDPEAAASPAGGP